MHRKSTAAAGKRANYVQNTTINTYFLLHLTNKSDIINLYGYDLFMNIP